MAKIILEPVFSTALNNMENASSFYVLSWTSQICIRDVFHDLSHEWAISSASHQVPPKETQPKISIWMTQMAFPCSLLPLPHCNPAKAHGRNSADPDANPCASNSKDHSVLFNHINPLQCTGCKKFCTYELVFLWYEKNTFKIFAFLDTPGPIACFP